MRAVSARIILFTRLRAGLSAAVFGCIRRAPCGDGISREFSAAVASVRQWIVARCGRIFRVITKYFHP
jgi:hypothetical protein